MQIKVVFSSDWEIILPIHYNEHLQGFVYKSLDDDIGKILHNEGFKYEKRSFKLFSFSRIIGEFRLFKDRGVIVFKPPIIVWFSFGIREVGLSFLKNIYDKRQILAGNPLTVSDVNIKTYDINNDLVVKTLSPITAYRTVYENGKRKTVYYSPRDENFINLVKFNLLKKYKVVYGEDYYGDLEFKGLRGFKMSIVKYKNTVIKAWNGVFYLKGDKSILELALYCGLGVKNSQGFGFIIPRGVSTPYR